MNHRQKAEELGRYFDWEKDTEQVREIASALKEVEEETFARAIGCVERGVYLPDFFKQPEDEWNRGYFKGFDNGKESSLDALREEARKEGV